MLTVYGIPNCDTVKKATTWLKEHGVAFIFHDYKKQGITAAKLQNWSKQVGWEILLNKKGTTWREVGADVQTTVINENAAISFLKEYTSAIKRPVIEREGQILAVGYDQNKYTELL